jgi:hypothetical protein
MVLASGIALPALYTFDGFPRADFRSVVEIVSNRIPADGLVLHDNKLSYFPCQVLAPDLKQAFLPDEPGSMNDTLAPATQAALGITPAKDVETAVQDHSSVYFVVFRQAIQEYLDMGQAGHPTLSWLDQRYHRTEILEVGDLSVYVYQEGRE